MIRLRSQLTSRVYLLHRKSYTVCRHSAYCMGTELKRIVFSVLETLLLRCLRRTDIHAISNQAWSASSAGCWSHFKKLPCMGFVANPQSTSTSSSSLMARMRSALVIGTALWHTSGLHLYIYCDEPQLKQSPSCSNLHFMLSPPKPLFQLVPRLSVSGRSLNGQSRKQKSSSQASHPSCKINLYKVIACATNFNHFIPSSISILGRNTTSIDGNGALFLLPPNFNLPRMKRISTRSLL